MLLTFLVSILLIRYLGPKQYGTWAYALSFVSLFTSMSALGLESIFKLRLSGFFMCK